MQVSKRWLIIFIGLGLLLIIAIAVFRPRPQTITLTAAAGEARSETIPPDEWQITAQLGTEQVAIEGLETALYAAQMYFITCTAGQVTMQPNVGASFESDEVQLGLRNDCDQTLTLTFKN